MKKLFEQATQIAVEAQMIADSLEEHNPGLRKDKVPLDVIQHDIACLGRELTWLYTELGKKIKKD